MHHSGQAERDGGGVRDEEEERRHLQIDRERERSEGDSRQVGQREGERRRGRERGRDRLVWRAVEQEKTSAPRDYSDGLSTAMLCSHCWPAREN